MASTWGTGYELAVRIIDALKAHPRNLLTTLYGHGVEGFDTEGGAVVACMARASRGRGRPAPPAWWWPAADVRRRFVDGARALVQAVGRAAGGAAQRPTSTGGLLRPRARDRRERYLDKQWHCAGCAARQAQAATD